MGWAEEIPMAEKPTAQDTATADAITRGIVEGMTALAASLKPQGPLEQAGLTPERIAAIKELPKPQKYREIPWHSHETGATGIAIVVESKALKNGRITQIKGYTHPAEAYVSESEGGHVPNGFPMWRDGRARETQPGREPEYGDLTPLFLQWRYERYYQADLRRYIGHEVGPHCASAEALASKWVDSAVSAQASA